MNIAIVTRLLCIMYYVLCIMLMVTSVGHSTDKDVLVE